MDNELLMRKEASSVYNRPRISQEKASQAPFENGSHRIKKRSSIRENYYLFYCVALHVDTEM